MNKRFINIQCLLAMLCLTGCDDFIAHRAHSLDTGTGDPNQWVPSGQAMQALTPRAVALMGAQCVLMRFEWYYLEEDLQFLTQGEIDQIQSQVQARFGQRECGARRVMYGLLATTPAADRGPLVAQSSVWFVPGDGHALCPETLSQFEPAARLPAVEVAVSCPDFEAYLQGRKAPSSISARQWQAMLRALRSDEATAQLMGGGSGICEQVFAGDVPSALPAPQKR